MSESEAVQLPSDAGTQLLRTDPFEGTQYRAVMRLAAGGMGEVFLVEQPMLGKRFAAKMLHASLAEDRRLLERMRVEAEALGSLQHANIVAAFDFQRTRDRRPFLVMEYLKGRTLDEELEVRGPIEPIEALGLTLQLLSALRAAHGLGLVHRDLKPTNLFLCDEIAGTRLLKVLDFGVARVLPGAPANAPDPTAVPTATGAVMGTPRYLSPEGAAGQKVDTRADLYATALMLYFMLTGRGPFDELQRDTEILAAHATLEPPPPSRFAGSVTPELDALVLKGLAKGADQRYRTAEEFAKVLERHSAMLRCPTKLRETAVISDQASILPSESVVPSASAKSVMTSNSLGLTVWGSVALFVLAGVITALVLLTFGGVQ